MEQLTALRDYICGDFDPLDEQNQIMPRSNVPPPLQDPGYVLLSTDSPESPIVRIILVILVIMSWSLIGYCLFLIVRG